MLKISISISISLLSTEGYSDLLYIIQNSLPPLGRGVVFLLLSPRIHFFQVLLVYIEIPTKELEVCTL